MAVRYATFDEALQHGGPLVAEAWIAAFGGKTQPREAAPARRRKRDAWKAAAVVVGGKRPGEFRSKLEWQFWCILWLAFEAGGFASVDYESEVYPAIGEGTYRPDFPTTLPDGRRVMWETKGFLRPKDRLRMIGAAEKHPGITWVIVTRAPNSGAWRCRYITAAGVSREVFCPAWLGGVTTG